MKETEKEGEKSLACGYGLLGLCCSACLLGPCRISPFDEEEIKGLCGDDRDLIVAKNLLRQVAVEGVAALKDLKEIIEEYTAFLAVNDRKRLRMRVTKDLAQKYGLSSTVSQKKLLRFLHEALKQFFSPFPGDTSPLLHALYREKIFPHLHKNHLLSGSLMGLLLHSGETGKKGSATVETILSQCLKISLHILISQELRSDLKGVIFKENPQKSKGGVFETLRGLASQPSPLLILLLDEDTPFKEEIDEIVGQMDRTIPFLSLSGVSALPDIGRELFKKWLIPLPEMSVLTLVSSKSVTSVLGPLALGFNVTSIPLLPIHGSERVEDFFSKVLKNRFGNLYLTVGKEDLSSAILNFLRRNV